MQKGACCPSTIKEWNEELDFEDEVEHAATRLSNLYVDYTNLRGHINMGYEYADPEGVISQAAAIDADCAEWAETCPLLYTYRTVTIPFLCSDSCSLPSFCSDMLPDLSSIVLALVLWTKRGLICHRSG
jgi:hypothetical protein